MKRTSLNVFIETHGITSILPWVNNAPDFTGIEEPSLSILRIAWERDKDNIEVIPSLESQDIFPDWDGLSAEVLNGKLFPLFTKLTTESINSSAIGLARNDINLCVTSIRNEAVFAASLIFLQQSGFTFSEEEKQLWNNTLQRLRFTSIVML